jgi:6-phosphogluconolactonase
MSICSQHRQAQIRSWPIRMLLWVLVFAVFQGPHSSVEANSTSRQHQEYWVYVGTASYTGGPSNELYLCRFDPATGRLTLQGVAAKTVNPGFVAVHPSKPFVYAVNEIGDFQGQKNGAVSSFRIDESNGKLILLNQRAAFGANPGYVTVSANGRFALVASYYGGIASFPIRENGSLGEAVSSIRETGVGIKAARPDGSHPHCVVFSPDGRFVVAADLGLDRILVYKFDPIKGTLTRDDPAFSPAGPGSGPRHLVFAPDARRVYVVHELGSSVSTYAYEPKSGILHLLQSISTLPSGFRGHNTGAEIQVSRTGEFLYTSNRGHDSIAVFAVDPRTGTLAPIQDISTGGKTPRDFVIDPSGNFLLVANQDSNEIVLFRIDQKTGRLSAAPGRITVPSPTCLVFRAVG